MSPWRAAIENSRTLNAVSRLVTLIGRLKSYADYSVTYTLLSRAANAGRLRVNTRASHTATVLVRGRTALKTAWGHSKMRRLLKRCVAGSAVIRNCSSLEFSRPAEESDD